MATTKYVEYFEKADSDKNGYLSLSEVTTVLKKNGYNEKQIGVIFEAMDTNNDQKISMEEYMAAMNGQPSEMHKSSQLRKIFNFFDTDSSGTITRDELKKGFQQMQTELTESEVERMMQLMDTNKDDSIDYEEFVHSMFGNYLN